jgi:hydroxymethylpyrimidine/phosphomethylpyrimidine kinase
VNPIVFKTADGRWVNGKGEEFVEQADGSFEPKVSVGSPNTVELEAKLADMQAAKVEADANYQRADERAKALEAKLAVLTLGALTGLGLDDKTAKAVLKLVR